MELRKNDFIEIDFTARIKDTGEVFDSNIASELEKINPNYNKDQAKPFIFPLGNEMFLKGVEEFLIGKPDKTGEHKIELTSDKAFGKRDPKLMSKIPTKIFMEHKINPIPGVMFNFDGRIAKILAVSGGRVIADFNNPIAGKDVIYDIKLIKKIDDINEKVKNLTKFLFRKEMDFEIKDKTIILSVEKQIKPFVEMFKEKFKEILGFDLETKEIGKEVKPEETNK